MDEENVEIYLTVVVSDHTKTETKINQEPVTVSKNRIQFVNDFQRIELEMCDVFLEIIMERNKS